MASSFDSVRQLVNENPPDEFLTASSILIRFANNVLENPNNSKYRRIRIANSTVQDKLLNMAGGMECLFEMGFQEAEDGECLQLPSTSNLQMLRRIKDDLNKEREKMQQRLKSQESQVSASSASTRPPAPSQIQTVRTPEMFMDSEAAFLGRLKEGMRRVMHYENPSTKQKARDVIPIGQLEREAKERLETGVGARPRVDMRDSLLLALLGWFKKSFFRWVDTLPCSQCGGTTRNTGSASPSYEELRWGAGRVEAHLCDSCGHVNRFPRYTNPEKLLETRQGRCGEWADCFTLCCRALDFEARYIMDWTDHVWTEVYSNFHSRWLHCDPCENICDKPLLYESGWGKKLTYVIAFSKDDIQDVTWRYSAKHQEVLARRKLCRESWLRHTINKLWHQKLASLPQDRHQEQWKRLICELTEFLTSKRGNAEALPGRTTGSLGWRQARGEVGTSLPIQPHAVKNKFSFVPTDAERESEIIHVVYNCAIDAYIRMSSRSEEIHGWETGTYASSGVFRKEELDWKMVYLAREEGTLSAEVTWKFDVTDTDLRVSKVEFRAKSNVYENGSVYWQLCAGDNCFTQNGASLQEFMTFDLHGSKNLSITAIMKGGKGDLAWQHTQLFRQSADDRHNYPFEIKLFLD